MFPANIATLAEEVLSQARARHVMVAAAESCTGGLVLGALTAIAGSSDVVAGGIVSYSNAAKEALLSVPHDVLEREGAVSEPVARAMAEGAAWALKADLAVSITGVAGPGGGSEGKPVGMVCFAVAGGAETLSWTEQFGDLGREQVRLASVERALNLLLERILGRA